MNESTRTFPEFPSLSLVSDCCSAPLLTLRRFGTLGELFEEAQVCGQCRKTVEK